MIVDDLIKDIGLLVKGGGGGITPTGTIQLTQNGVYNVSSYANADVNVQSEEYTAVTVRSGTYYSGSSLPAPNTTFFASFNESIQQDEKVVFDIPINDSQSTVLMHVKGQIYSTSPFTSVVVHEAYTNAYPYDTLQITQNGVADVTNYSSVDVDVPSTDNLLKVNEDQSVDVIDFTGQQSIRAYMFYMCQTLTGIDMPDATYIGERAFMGCTSIGKIGIPDRAYLGEYAFAASSITSQEIPASTLSEFAFAYCNSLTDVELSYYGGVSLGRCAFIECTNLVTITIDNCRSLGDSVFSGCSKLERVDLDGTLTSIPSTAFRYCNSLNTLIIRKTSAVVSLDGSIGVYPTIYVPDDLVNSYKTATNWSQYEWNIHPISELV